MLSSGFKDFMMNSTEGMVICVLVLVTLLYGFFAFTNKNKKKIALKKDEWLSLPLIKKVELTHDVRLFRFGLQSPEHILGLPIGQHISFKYHDDNGKLVQRSYTPTSSDLDVGYVDFVIKVYFKDVHPKFPEGGKMSQYLNNLKIGDKALLKGPKGTITFKGNGNFDIVKNRQIQNYSKIKKLGFIAGGTGITPILQLVRAILRDPNDHTEMFLLFANQTEEDILLREELEKVRKDRLHIWYTLDRPPEKWAYSAGFINAAMLKEHMPAPDPETLVFVCGPPPMVKYACEPALKELGFGDDQWHGF